MDWWGSPRDLVDLLGGGLGFIDLIQRNFGGHTVPGHATPAPAQDKTSPAKVPAQSQSPQDNGGQADAAAQDDANRIQAAIDQLNAIDQNADPVATMQAAQQAATDALTDIQTQYQHKLAALTPRLKNNDASAWSELPGLYNEAVNQTKQVLDDQNTITQAAALRSQALCQHYNAIAPPGSPAPPASLAPPGTATGSVQTNPAGASGMMDSSNPLGQMWPLLAMEMVPQIGSMGSSLLNSGVGGVTSALGTLGGLGSSLANRPPVDDASRHDEHLIGDDKPPAAQAPAHDPGAATNAVADHEDKGKDGDGATVKAASNGGHGEAGAAVPAGSSKEVPLPGGGTAHAGSEQAATAARAVLNGRPIKDAFQEAGIPLPPPGAPVTPMLSVSPNSLHAGDVAQFKDHQVLALGDGKVLISGQVVSQDQIGSSPDFMGWMRPTSGQEPPARDHAHSAPSSVPADVVS